MAGRAQLNITLPQLLLEFSSSGLEESGQKGILEVPFPFLLPSGHCRRC